MSTSIPIAIERSLERVPPGCQVAILVRHAERGPISDPVHGHHVLLTEAGAEAARALGRRLAARGALAVFHSPIERCHQTARALLEGCAAQAVEGHYGGPVPGLGGPYLRDPLRALELARDLGAKFIRAWFDNRIGGDVVTPLEVAAREQLAILREKLGQPARGPRLLVTHDWNLLLIREHFLGLRHEEAGWPGFLDGIVAFDEGSGLRLVYRGEFISPAL